MRSKAEVVEQLRGLLAEGLTISAAARCARIARETARTYAVEAGIWKTKAEQVAARDAKLLEAMDRLRGPGITIGRVSKTLCISPSKLAKLWQATHPNVPYRLPAVARDPAKPVAPIVAGGVAGVFIPRGCMSKEEWREHRNAAVLHGRRTKNLPPVTDNEAADLVAQFFARGGRVTLGRPAATAPINSGRGFY